MSKASNQSADKDHEKLVKLSNLILLQKQARRKEKRSELGFFITNETHKLIPYKQAIFWEKSDTGAIRISAASGLSDIDQNAPFMIWLTRIIKSELKKRTDDETRILAIKKDDLSEADQADWNEYCAQHALIYLFKTHETGKMHGGLWLERDTPFDKSDLTLLEELGDSYVYALDRIKRAPETMKDKVISWLSLSHTKKAILVIVALILLFPVRLSVTAPVEIVPEDPYVVSPAISGVIDNILVEPNSVVKEGDPLIKLDDTSAKSQSEIASKALRVAQAAFTKASRQAFSDASSKAETAILKAEVDIKRAEFEYAQNILNLIEINAPRSGTAIFSDPNSLRGLPVKAGERIMLLADPAKTKAKVRIPTESMIEINNDVDIRIFLNIAPLNSIIADIQTVSYEATPDPDGLLTYKIDAVFDDTMKKPRVGLKGTAKVYGSYVPFFYTILRRPIIVLRRNLGI